MKNLMKMLTLSAGLIGLAGIGGCCNEKKIREEAVNQYLQEHAEIINKLEQWQKLLIDSGIGHYDKYGTFHANFGTLDEYKEILNKK